MVMLPESMEGEKVGHDHNQQYLTKETKLVGLLRTQGALLEEDLLPELEEEENLKIDEVHLVGGHPVCSDQMCSEE